MSPEEPGALRARIKAQRAQLDPAWAAEVGARMAARLLALPAWRKARRVGLYLALPGEAPTEALWAAARAEGRESAAPRYDRARRAYRFAWLGPEAALVPGALGILEPAAADWVEDVQSLELIVVPGVAFTKGGRRLGHGAGHYDRMLAGFHGIAIGWAFEFQLVDELDRQPHDIPMDAVITEAAFYAADRFESHATKP